MGGGASLPGGGGLAGVAGCGDCAWTQTAVTYL